MQGFCRVERGLNKARWGLGIRRHCRPYPLAGRGMFFARQLGLRVFLSSWVHVLTRPSTGSNPSNIDADVSIKNPEDTYNVFAYACKHISTYVFAAAFFQICLFFNPIFQLNSPKKCLRYYWFVLFLLWGISETLARSPGCLKYYLHGLGCGTRWA